GQRAEPAGRPRGEAGPPRVASGAGRPLVESEPLIDLWYIVVRQEPFHGHADHRIDRGDGRAARQFSHGFGEELRIKIVAHGGDVAVLLGAQEVAGAPDLEIAQGELEPRAELGQLLEGPEAPL